MAKRKRTAASGGREKCRVFLPLDARVGRWRIDGLGLFERGESQDLELTVEQAASLRGKGFNVTPRRAPWADRTVMHADKEA